MLRLSAVTVSKRTEIFRVVDPRPFSSFEEISQRLPITASGPFPMNSPAPAHR
jgi:hypothetical protein